MIVAVYTDPYGTDFVAVGEDIASIFKQLEEDSGEDNIQLSDMMVVVGNPVKVVKTVTYKIEEV